MGYVFSAFGLTYALLEIPSGWLCDRIGPRKVLTRIVLWWSFFTAATGWAWNLPSLLVTRLLFGAGEAGCFPGLAKSFRTWLPPSERPMAEGIKATSRALGRRLHAVPTVTLYRVVSWRAAFADLRRDRRRVGGRVLLVVSRRSRRAPGRQSSRAGSACAQSQRGTRLARTHALARISALPQRLGVVRAVVLPLLRLLLLHHLAADLSAEGARPEPAARRAPGRSADALSRRRQPVLRMARDTHVPFKRSM